MGTYKLQTNYSNQKPNTARILQKSVSLPNINENNQILSSRAIKIDESSYTKEVIEPDDENFKVSIIDIHELPSSFKPEDSILNVFKQYSVESNFLYFQSTKYNTLHILKVIINHKNKYVILFTIAFCLSLLIGTDLPFLEVCQFSILLLLCLIYITTKIESIVNNKIKYQYNYNKLAYEIKKNLNKHYNILLQNGIDDINIKFFYYNLNRNKLDEIFINENLNIQNKNMIINGFNNLQHNKINIAKLTKENSDFLLGKLNILSGLFIKDCNQYNMILKKRLICLKHELIEFMIKPDNRDCIHDILLINKENQDDKDIIPFFIPSILAYMAIHVVDDNTRFPISTYPL
jgi:hypothetical protein